MLLYDVYYKHSAGFDSSITLPTYPVENDMLAVCKNGPKQFLISQDNKWVFVSATFVGQWFDQWGHSNERNENGR
jgi:hypothetical protein